jgi:hypothetical protein
MESTLSTADRARIPNLWQSPCIICQKVPVDGIRCLKVERKDQEPQAAYAPLCKDCFTVEPETVWKAIRMEQMVSGYSE